MNLAHRRSPSLAVPATHGSQLCRWAFFMKGTKMRVFKPVYTDSKGKSRRVKKWWIELKDHNGIVRRFAAFTDEKQSKALGRKIEKLVVCKLNSEPPDRELSIWLEDIPAKLRERFAKIGLLDKARAAAGKKLKEHLDTFRNSLLAKGDTEKQVDLVLYRIERVFKECDFVNFSNINPIDVEACLKKFRDEGLGKKSSNYYLRSIHHFCGWMVENGLATVSPLKSLSGVKVTEDDIRVYRRALEVNEIRDLLETTEASQERFGMTGHQRAMLYRLAIETGLRAGELRSLTVSSFDFNNLTVTAKAAYCKNGKTAELSLRADTAEQLKALFAGKMSNVKAFSLPSKYVMADMLRADALEAGISYEGIDFHSLRHTAGSLLAYSGVHPKTAQTILRHSDINLTMSIYTHTLRGQESEAVESLPDFSVSRRTKKTGTDDKKLR